GFVPRSGRGHRGPVGCRDADRPGALNAVAAVVSRRSCESRNPERERNCAHRGPPPRDLGHCQVATVMPMTTASVYKPLIPPGRRKIRNDNNYLLPGCGMECLPIGSARASPTESNPDTSRMLGRPKI